MKKLIIFALFLLMATPVFAGECPEGETWVEENTVIEAHFEDGECNSWTEPVCTDYEWTCSLWGPFHILCWDWDKVCSQYSEPVCNGYEQVWVEEEVIDGGYCELEEEPIVEEPVFTGYHSMLMRPTIQNYATKVTVDGNDVTVGWLSSIFSYGGLLVKQQPEDINVGFNGRILGSSPVEIVTPDYLFGYDSLVEYDGVATWHELTTTLEAGTYYIRPISWFSNMYVDYLLGEEIEVIVE